MLRFISFKRYIFLQSHFFHDLLLQKLNLKGRKQYSYCIFLKKPLNDEVDDPNILSQIDSEINHHGTRSRELFFISHSSKKYLTHSSINSLHSAGIITQNNQITRNQNLFL